MTRHFFSYIKLIPFLFLLGSCSGVKVLQENQYFYDGAQVKLEAPEGTSGKKKLDYELQDYLSPEPNSVFLGTRLGVWFYYISRNPKKEKGLKSWIRRKLAKEPVFYSDVKPEKIKETLNTVMYNEGFFNASTSFSSNQKKHKKALKFTIDTGAPYEYSTINFPTEENNIKESIALTKPESILEVGDRYNLDQLRKERSRIEKILKDQGYFYFSADNLLFKADSTIGNHQLDLFLKVKKDAPEKSKSIYSLSEVNVFTEFTYNGDTSINQGDTVKIDGKNIIQEEGGLKPEILASYIPFKEGQTYTKEDELTTYNRLSQLDLYRYININYEEKLDNQLDTRILLSPYKKKSLRAEFNIVSKSNSFVGPNLSLIFQNRNTFGGGERLEIDLSSGYEVQVGGRNSNPVNAYNIGLNNSISIPRLLLPFKINRKSSRYLTRTNFSLDFELFNRVEFFQFNSLEFEFGYQWRSSERTRHEFNPVAIAFIDLSNTSREFDEVLDNNLTLASSFVEQFIIGSTYSFFYNTQVSEDKTRFHDFYLNLNLDVSGNTVDLIQDALSPSENDEPNEVFGQPYSQFVKFDGDIRNYFRLSRKHRIAIRLTGGIGYAYGNSSVLPYTKQFSIGGSSSIRAFPARSIGPGSFVLNDTTGFIDQFADLKLEANVEYRFDIVGSLKGAVFLDAGNIWSIRSEAERPEGRFDVTEFLDDIAIGTGFGARVDLDFFVIRLDLAFPVKVPDRDGNSFVIQDFAIWDSDWRDENLILNIAIGYPF
ncbi:MAG: BamA/TamA family outer membrane protein [Bacteroidota bacterium]